MPHVPLSHPFVERLIGTIRREFLDQVLFWNGRDLERKLADFQAYHNEARSHASLEGHTPLGFRTDARCPAPNLTRCAGFLTAGVWSSSQWQPNSEFETDGDETSVR